MKKKTKSRLSSKASAAFIIAILLCIIGAAGNFFGFYTNLTATLSKLNEESIGTITFKYKTAQRKFLDRIVWDRLKQKSDLYNGDTIHTSSAAEATITFSDGNRVELFESTMIQIWKDKDSGKSSADIFDGSVYAETDAENPDAALYLYSSANSKLGVTIDSNSAANVNFTKDGYIQIVSGSASVSNSEGTIKSLSQGESISVEENEIKLPAITVTSPAPNQKIVNHTKENQKVTFEWKLNNFPENSILLLELAGDKDFTQITNSTILNSFDHLNLNLKQGKYYWRIRSVNSRENDSAQITIGSSLQIIQSLPPQLLSPVQDYEYKFRTRKPAVRLIWSESAKADSYRLVIADNAHLNKPVISQRTGSTSAIISTLPEGTWFWQITPYFRINKEGFAAHSEVHSFTIDKSGDLKSPVILVPTENSIVNIERDARKSYFSWKLEDEAVNYKVKFSRNADFSSEEKVLETTNNYISLKGFDEFTTGQWYWQVIQSDSEGNLSAPSKIQSFYAMEGQPEQHTIEPVEGYGVAQTLMPDMNFTWKKNLPDFYSSVIEISTDEGFKNIIYTGSATGYSLSGLSLAGGKYYWRLNSVSTVDGFTMTTPPKSFEVLPNLDATKILAPVYRAVARDSVPYTFKWEPVENADYYKVNIYRNPENLLIFEETVYDSSFTLDMFNSEQFIDRRDYRIEIQAKANAIPGVVSRRSGNLSEAGFHLVKLRPVEITMPAKKAILDGVDAALNKVKVAWRSVDIVSQAQIIISRRNGNITEPVYKLPSDEEFNTGNKIAPSSVLFANPDLRNGGDYEILVLARTLDDIDISNTDPKYLGEFTIKPVEPLPAASNLVTKPETFDAKYLKDLKNPRTITFNWMPVRNATSYTFEIKNQKGKILFNKVITGKSTCEVNWLELIQAQTTEKEKKELYSGKFNWTVEAIRMIDTDNDGILDTQLQPGNLSQGNFQTNVPVTKSASGKGAKNPYGK